MKVIRSHKCKIGNEGFHIGDQISMELENLGTFTLTAQAVEEDGTRAWFLFDQPVTSRPRDGLEEWLYARFKCRIPQKWRKRILDICIPSYEQIFGNGICIGEDEAKWYKEYIVPTDDEQFELMRRRANRIRYDEKDNACWWWLRNAYEEGDRTISSTFFAGVNDSGNAYYANASDSRYVVPLILISNPNSERGDEDIFTDYPVFQDQASLFATARDAYKIMNKYGSLTISDLYSLAGIETYNFYHSQYGWKKGTKIGFEITKNGDAMLKMSSNPERLVPIELKEVKTNETN